MMFQRKLFGYHPTEVDSYIGRLEDQISEKDCLIDELIRQIRRMEYDQDVLNGRIAVLKEINLSRVSQEKNGQ